MRALAVVALSLAGLACAIGACTDLFHATTDVLTACEIDAASAGCAADASIDRGQPPTDFCAWTPVDARAHATHSCAWLGACESALGRNTFGECMIEATLAYDCSVNRAHRVTGARRALWDCLWQAKTCGDVDRCVWPRGRKPCIQGNFTACGSEGNDDVRIECHGTGDAMGAENCALWGQACSYDGNQAACAGDRDAGLACTQSGCFGSGIHWCADGGDVGIDCASLGNRCQVSDAGPWAACVPSEAGAPCGPTTAAACTAGGVATTCATGATETIDCAALLGGPGACAAGDLSSPFDWTGACRKSPPDCTADSCNGSEVVSCARGTSFIVNCAREGLGPCAIVSTNVGAEQRAACGRP